MKPTTKLIRFITCWYYLLTCQDEQKYAVIEKEAEKILDDLLDNHTNLMRRLREHLQARYETRQLLM